MPTSCRGVDLPRSFYLPLKKFELIGELDLIFANRAVSEIAQFANCNGNAFTLSINASKRTRSKNCPKHWTS